MTNSPVVNEEKRLFQLLCFFTILVSAAQGIFFLFLRNWQFLNLLGIIFATVSILAVSFFLKKASQKFVEVFIFYGLQAALFIYRFLTGEFATNLRLLQIAVLLLHCAILFAFLISILGILSFKRALMICSSIALSLLVLEWALPSQDHSGFAPEWSGKMEPHSELTAVYRPYSEMKTYYPTNPRNYFAKEDSREFKWWLHTGENGAAELSFPQDRPDAVRVEKIKCPTKRPYDVQANFSHLKVEKGQVYTIRFRTRADRGRSLSVGFSMSHEPWDGLGLYKQLDVTDQWKNFVEEVTTTVSDQNARVHFDLGADEAPVEISGIQIQKADGNLVQPDVPESKYLVSYKFNALGCRGPDYQIPRPANTQRILFLGDSYTLGVGVNQGDTFSSKLQNMLNSHLQPDGSIKHYDVINCGVSGYGTREERLFYDEYGYRYQPNLVTVVMVWNDDMSYAEEVASQFTDRKPSGFELLFHTWNVIQNLTHKRPFPNFSKCVNHILQLDDEVREQGGRLAIVIFRNNSDYSGTSIDGKTWNNLTTTVTNGLKGTNIPVLDLGESLFQNHKEEDLIVHAVDPHPNDLAHEIAAQEIFSFFQSKKLVPNF